MWFWGAAELKMSQQRSGSAPEDVPARRYVVSEERQGPPQAAFTVERPAVVRAADIVAWFLLIGMWAYLGLVYGDLPDRIPHHFDASGAPDRWGGKSILIFLACLSSAIFALLTFLLRKPNLWNVPRGEDEAHTARILVATDQLVRFLRLLTTALFSYVQMITVRIARGEAATLGWPFILMVIGGVAAPLVWYFVAIRRANR